ncbi:LOW QUALITY PROTEIN: zinc finger protein CG2199 [Drosophila eugracilis]|uniref:LOW QUALITY PROTEIN: zinc finger protein CG2199 n=1 Tax=Drosophila eugracilis TaxID=29029 RepID=UPI0007E6F657|nr:LOW QUALITY PROTEIN: zinc finger protein CG2199 [Drosophila eugracilis]
MAKGLSGQKNDRNLETITHRSIPANAPIKICFLCASSLRSATGLIERICDMVERILATSPKKSKASKAAEKAEDSEEQAQEIVDLTSEAKKPVKAQKKNTTIRQRSKSIAAFPASSTVSDFALQESFKESPKKLEGTPRKLQSRLLEDNLDDSVKLTPAKNVSSTKKVFLNLFGNGDNDAIELQTESEDDETGGEAPIAVNTNRFQCSLCEFQAKYPNPFKDHLQKVHGQQRPRIYPCPLCTKNFGVLKTLKDHLKVVHSRTLEPEAKAKTKDNKKKEAKSEEKQIEEPKPKEPKTKTPNDEPKEVLSKPKKTEDKKKIKSKDTQKEGNSAEEQDVNKAKLANKENADATQEPKVASFKALNESIIKKKLLENVIDSDYTFAVNGSSASTPRAESSDFQCEICDCVLPVAKQMQEHMKLAHNIDKPKVFKCQVCEKSLATKQSLKTHMTIHNDSAEVGKSSKRKILQDEDDVDNIEISFQETDNTVDDEDDEPKEETIIREKSKKDTSLKTLQSQDEGVMPAPLSPAKKAKKAKTSLLDISVATTNGKSPSKTEKRRKHNTSETSLSTSDGGLLEEVNHNVKPHKKARLESIGDSTADESTLSCDQCGKFVTSRQRLDAHIQKKHGFQLKCPACQNIYSNQLDYVGHFSECSTLGGLPCGVSKCKKFFTDAEYLGSHLRKRHQWV